MDEQKPNNRERVREIVAGIEKNIQELFQSEKYFDYLRTMSRFHNYSLNKTLLIYVQRPDAAQPVAGFQKWKQFDRHVRKGEKGLTIIAPTPVKRKIEEMKLDLDTKAPVIDRDGNVIMEEKTIEIPFFKPVKVFSADQTEGKPGSTRRLWKPCGAPLPCRFPSFPSRPIWMAFAIILSRPFRFGKE